MIIISILIVRSPHIPCAERLGTDPFNALQIRLSRCRLISFYHFLFRPLLEPPPPLLASPTSPSPQRETNHHTPSRSRVIAFYSLHLLSIFTHVLARSLENCLSSRRHPTVVRSTLSSFVSSNFP